VKCQNIRLRITVRVLSIIAVFLYCLKFAFCICVLYDRVNIVSFLLNFLILILLILFVLFTFFGDIVNFILPLRLLCTLCVMFIMNKIKQNKT